MKKTNDKVNIINKFVEEILNVTKQIFNNLFVFNTKELIKFIVELLIIIAFIYILKIPFDLIKDIGNSAFDFLFTPVDKIIIILWSLIIEVAYLIFAVVVFIYLFNKSYEKEKKSKIKKEEYEEVFTDLYRGFIIIVSLPLVLTLILLVTLFLVSLYLLSQGLPYYSFIIVSISLIGLNLLGIYKIYQYLNRKRIKKNYIKRVSTIFIVTLVLGIALLIFEISGTRFYHNSIPNIDYEIKNQTLETNINETIKITCRNCYDNYDIIYDNSLNNKIVIEVVYYDEFVQPLFRTSQKEIIISGEKLNLFNESIQATLINDLKKKELHDYTLLHKQRLSIWISEGNFNNLKVSID